MSDPARDLRPGDEPPAAAPPAGTSDPAHELFGLGWQPGPDHAPEEHVGRHRAPE